MLFSDFCIWASYKYIDENIILAEHINFHNLFRQQLMDPDLFNKMRDKIDENKNWKIEKREC